MVKMAKAVLLDLSGTVHVGDHLIPGAKVGIQMLKSHGIPIKYVTNTSKESKSCLRNRLCNAGLEVQENELFTSLTAARNYVESLKLRPLLMLEDEAMKDFEGIQTEDPNSVVVGLSPSNFHYKRLNEAFNLLKNRASLIAINKSRYIKTDDGLSIGTGAFVSTLEFASDKKAHVIGKPSKDFFHLALKELDPKLQPHEALMVGDDVRDDVLGAQQAGLIGALVKTGKYLLGDENKYGEPNYVFENLEEMAQFVLGQEKK
eukprot:TRINITY_DN1530_c0_g1_i21.p1 TRINITY_DN1530_c0_g1~~TRINITY_DN1530_c0_g1_i21.p1  ORF type:complete len:260 (-),score=41.18 TRINITY_DN1530_c0_g1_i21:4-783(-)